jgi:hypothetical protein
MNPVMEFDQQLNRPDRRVHNVRNDIVLGPFDIELQDIDVLQPQQRQNGIVAHYVAYDGVTASCFG